MSGSLPSFLIIGAMKAGTTSLHRYLAGHPALHLPEAKELNFFVAEHNWPRGVDWYARQFSGAPAGAVLGEASPDYTKWPHYDGVPERIRQVVPEVRLVYLLRHPVERMRSMYLHQVRENRERRAIDVALLEDEHYRECSMYATQLDRYLEHFPSTQILVVLTEDLQEDPLGTLDRICRFVDVAPYSEVVGGNAQGVELNRSSDLGRKRALTGLLTRSPLYPTLRRLVPDTVFRQARRVGLAAVDESRLQDMAPSVRAELSELLAPDVLRLEAHVPGVGRRWQIT